MSHHRSIFVLPVLGAVALVFGLLSSVQAQDSAAVPPPAASPITLLSVLTTAQPPDEGVAIAVDAQKVKLPSGVVLPGTVPTIAEVADAFGRTPKRFGVVTAVAPPTMVVLNTSPSNPSPFDGMPPGDAFRLLAASLTAAQWQTLTGDRGLGLTDLTDDVQRGLFQALFPGGHLKVHPRPAPGSEDDGKSDRDIAPSDLAQARLKMGRRVDLTLPVVDHPGEGRFAPQSSAVFTYETSYGDPNADADVLYGVRLRADVPNVPKPAQLDWKNPVLTMPVVLQGVKTVGGIIARIAAATHLELYSDRLYEGRALTVVGTAPTAPAGDLLHALAFCLCGTFRQVGPAYVLTDDLLGLGTRRAILRRFTQSAEMARHGPLQDASDKVVSSHALDGLPALGSSTDFSPDEAKAGYANGGFPNSGRNAELPLSQLTPEQQALARQAKALDDAEHDRDRVATEAAGQTYTPTEILTLEGKIGLMTQPTVEMILPSLNGPVDMDNSLSEMWNLFMPSETLRSQWEQAKEKASPAAARPRVPPPTPPSVDLTALLRPYTHRAVLAAPRTAHDLDVLVGSMKTCGLNELWLPVFPTPSTAPPNLLLEALKATKGSGIAVCPVLDLLVWDPKPPEADVDLTLLGETSAQDKAAEERYRDTLYQDFPPDTLEEIVGGIAHGGVAVSPAAPEVRQSLLDAIGRLAATPGVAGLVWRDTVTPGYNKPTQSDYATDDGGVGYTIPMRLAFLRLAHTDPVDLDGDLEARSQNTIIRGFNNNAITYPLSQQWNAFRAEINTAFLRSLTSAAHTGTGKNLPILVEERRQGTDGHNDWFGSWDRPTAPLPALSEDLAYSGQATPQTVAAFAKTQSRVVLGRLAVWEGLTPSYLATMLKETLAGPPWDGFVLDCTGIAPPGDPLAGLAAGVRPAAATKTH